MAEVHHISEARSYGRPRLWSDFDGTAVEKFPKWDPRNWTKYPLPMVEGYTAFLHGAQTQGLEIGGVVSRRPNIAPRRWATARSIARLGLDHFFNEGSIKLAGSERGKAEHLLSEAAERKIAVIDDQPHKIGHKLIELMRAHHNQEFTSAHTKPVVLGVVDTPHALDDVQSLRTEANQQADYVERRGLDFRVYVGRQVLSVVRLDPFTEESGRIFAEQVKNGPTAVYSVPQADKL